MLNYLGQGGVGREILFSLVADRSAEEEIGIEVYDRDGSLAAWEGPSGMPGTEEVRSGLAGRTTSRVTRKTFVSYLDVSVPVVDSGAVVGAVVVRRRLESSVPLNDVVLHAPGMGEILSTELGTTVDFTFAGEGETSPHGSFRTALLYGLDSLQIGSVSVADPPRSAYTENVVSRFNAMNAVLVIVLIVVCAARKNRGNLETAPRRVDPCLGGPLCAPLVRSSIRLSCRRNFRSGVLCIEVWRGNGKVGGRAVHHDHRPRDQHGCAPACVDACGSQ